MRARERTALCYLFTHYGNYSHTHTLPFTASALPGIYMAANGCGAVMLLLLPLLASSPGSASASVCIFVPAPVSGRKSSCSLAAFQRRGRLRRLPCWPATHLQAVHGCPTVDRGAKRLCSAVYGMHAIVAHDEQRTCYIYPSSAEKGACDAAPSACTGTYESPDLLLDSAQLTGHVPTQLGRLSATLEALALEGNPYRARCQQSLDG